MSLASPEGQITSRPEEPNAHVNLARKAALGAAALGLRQVLTYGANILGGVMLARLLSPGEFGFYAVVSLLLSFLNLFGGTGLAGNLIRAPEEPTLASYRAVFTAQQLIVAVICIGVWISAPIGARLYHLPLNSLWFFRLTALSLFLTSLMVIPQVKLERNLSFDKLALIEVSQAVAFNAVAIFLAWRGFGITAFAIGLVARSAVGAGLANIISPWPVGFHRDYAELKSHARFGVTLQGIQLLTMLKDSITPVFVGMFLGPTQMGYATWALTFSGYPMLLLMPMQRLYLPFFARLQHDRYALAHFVPRALWIANVIAAPLAVLSVALARPITSIVFGDKWLIALPLFYCFFATNISTPSVSPLMGLLNALGKPQHTLWVIALSMISIWALGVPLIMRFGLFGFGLATMAASLVNFFLYWIVWRETTVLPWRSYWPAWPLSLCIGAIVYGVQREAPLHTIGALAAYFVSGLTVYFAVLWLGFRRQSAPWVRLMRSARA